MRTAETSRQPGKAAAEVTVTATVTTAAASSNSNSAAAAPPSYDDVMQSVHEELAVSENGQASSSTAAAVVPPEMGPFSTAKSAPAEDADGHGEALPLIVQRGSSGEGAGNDPSTLSSRDFFSSLEYKRTSKGYSSTDALLNTDARALRRFITETNERPRVTIEVEGSHMEDRPTRCMGQDSCGDNSQHERQQHGTSVYQESHSRREKVVDFRFSLELTPFIHDKGSLYTARQPTGEPYGVDAILQDYVDADNVLKEISVQKKAIWDYGAVRQLIINYIQVTVGYPHTVTVTFPMENDRVCVKSNSAIGRLWRHPVTSFLCFISCVCAVGWPIRYMATQRWRNKLMSDFVVLVAPHDFVARHADFIRSQVSWPNTPFTIVTTI